MTSGPALVEGAHRATVTADTFTLSWRTGARGLTHAPHLALRDADGARWMRLCVLSSIHTAQARDEATRVHEPEVSVEDDAVVLRIRTESPAWTERVLVLRCTAAQLEITLECTGTGSLTDVTMLGGDGALPSGASGTFRSGIHAQSMYVPAPTEPVAFVRPAWAGASLGVVGDATPGRLHGIFSPPPLALEFGRAATADPFSPAAGGWLAAWLRAPVSELGFTAMRFDPLDGAGLLRLAYEGHTHVDGSWRSPTVVLRPVESPLTALRAYRNDAVRTRTAPDAAPELHRWWLEPLFCGWGAQYARAGRAASSLCRQDVYDEFLDLLAAARLDPGTVVIDDRWQAEYGTAEPDTEAWPDLRGWIARRHAEGRRVLLWWKAWDPGGLPVEECITDASGRPIAADPGNPAYLSRLDAIVERLVSAGELDADGFKVDFTQRAPSGATLRSSPDGDGVWGIAALHRLVERLHDAVKRIKPDALVITHTVHPGFGDVTDMIRTNDVLKRDLTGQRVSVAAQLRARHQVVQAVLPHHPIDTDQWPMPSRDEWLDYARAQPGLGVPALYYIDRVRAQPIEADHLAVIGRAWDEHRGTLT
ncbi:hypothetical protein [Microbacterium wangchenii]|uniref:hypothetical protein n=1 Tax=Microbacterium wangchenii TaxID=2541726 RepID=UPI00362A3BBC